MKVSELMESLRGVDPIDIYDIRREVQTITVPRAIDDVSLTLLWM